MFLRVIGALLAMVALAEAGDPVGQPPPGTGEETRRAVIALLRENRLKYGDDAAIMQGLLLVHANQSGAILATESAIVGFEDNEKRRYVTFRVDSGTIFDDKTMSREQRLEQIWHSILERTLLRYPTFSVPGDGIAVEILYSHRPYESVNELYHSIDDRGEIERAKFYLLTEHLSDFIGRRLDARGLLERSKVLLDEKTVRVDLHEFVGPPLPTPEDYRDRSIDPPIPAY